MVLNKRLDYGFHGYQVPNNPRATRSARRKRSFWKKVDDNEMCSFDLLASVAGKLLCDGDVRPNSNHLLAGNESSTVNCFVKEEQPDVDNVVTIKPHNQGISSGDIVASKLVSRPPVLDHGSQELLQAYNNANFDLASTMATLDCSEKIASPDKAGIEEQKIGHGLLAWKVDDFFACRLEKESKEQIKVEPQSISKAPLSQVETSSSEGPVVWDPEPVSPCNKMKLSFFRDCTPHICTDDAQLGFRDDDENSSSCYQPAAANKAYRPLLRNGDRKIRKLLLSKYWRVTPKLKNEEEGCNDAEVKRVLVNQKSCFKRQRPQKDYPFKKRKFDERVSLSNSDGGISCNSASGSPKDDYDEDTSGLCIKVDEARAGQHDGKLSKSGGSNVKLKIKSFRVPELFIEIPETATVGSLKRTVMEALAQILGGELHVGVFLRGKKIGDDNKTLLQSGISHDKKLDTLGFTLEPNNRHVLHPHRSETHPFLFHTDMPQPISRYQPALGIYHNKGQKGTSASDDLPVMSHSNFNEDCLDSTLCRPEMTFDKVAIDSRALIAVPAIDAEVLSVVPLQKSKRSEVVQRRTRRPFSVFEVEALVEAVEKLGTGRWRDVKLRAFDNAQHRTYVDLKDKWKTLVHTARISPQQRRGKPVPQELLDRVLTAHAYWSQQQAKHQLRQ